MKVLIVNILKDPMLKNGFDRKMNYLAEVLKFNKDIKYTEELEQIHGFGDYSHFIISGSEASVLDWEPWFGALEILINRFTEARKPILGICFGHQFLAKMFCGESVIQKAQKPEFGWTDIILEKDSLFEGLSVLKSLVLHYDEVLKLDERFKVIASSDRCRIQGFKMIDKPIWGVQFHPDFLFDDGIGILKSIKLKETKFEAYSVYTEIDKEQYESNVEIFRNFIL